MKKFLKPMLKKSLCAIFTKNEDKVREIFLSIFKKGIAIYGYIMYNIKA